MAAPLAARQILFPLYAFNVEVARAPWVASEPMIGEMRLQWWRDVLEEIGADEVPLLEVYNKIDQLDGVEPHVERDGEGKPVRVWLSAMKGAGLDLLQEVLEELVGADQVSGHLVLSPGQGALRAALYREGHVEEEGCRDDGSLELHVTLSRKRYEQLMKEFEALKSLQRESSGHDRVTASSN